MRLTLQATSGRARDSKGEEMNTKQRTAIIIVLLLSSALSSCAPRQLVGPTATPSLTSTTVAISTPIESPEEIIMDAVKTACQFKPADSSIVGVSTGGEAVARVCPIVDFQTAMHYEITLPDEWRAKTPEDLHYVVDYQTVPEGNNHQCGPYNPGPTYLSSSTQDVEITLINAQTGDIMDSARVEGTPPSNCPSVMVIHSTSPLIGIPPSTQEVQKAIVDLVSKQVYFPTLQTLKGHTDRVTSVAFSPDGKLLASGSWDNTVKLWDVVSGQEVRTLTGHVNHVTNIAFSPDGKLLASGSTDKTVKLWDVASGQEVRTLTSPTDFVTSVAFSPDGKLLASGSWVNTVKLWDVASGQEVRTLTGHTDWVQSVAFSPDGKLLASGSTDKTVMLWDVASGQDLRTLTGHTANVNSVAFSPNGKLLASASSDKAVILWDAASGQQVCKLTGYDVDMLAEIGHVFSVAFSPDGKLLASGSDDNMVMLREVKLP
jgi:WD40 repeat protein